MTLLIPWIHMPSSICDITSDVRQCHKCWYGKYLRWLRTVKDFNDWSWLPLTLWNLHLYIDGSNEFECVDIDFLCWVMMITSWLNTQYMWQSRVEIKDYSVAYFNCIVAFKTLYHWTSVKGGAHMHFIDLLDIQASTKHVSAPPLTKVQWYSALNAAMRSKYAME